MSKIIGIDLGTTYSAIAQLDDLGNPEVLASTDSNKKITASVVYIKDKNVIVGDKALDALTATPKNVATFVLVLYLNILLFNNKSWVAVTPSTVTVVSDTVAEISALLTVTPVPWYPISSAYSMLPRFFVLSSVAVALENI